MHPKAKGSIRLARRITAPAAQRDLRNYSRNRQRLGTGAPSARKSTQDNALPRGRRGGAGAGGPDQLHRRGPPRPPGRDSGRDRRRGAHPDRTRSRQRLAFLGRQDSRGLLEFSPTSSVAVARSTTCRRMPDQPLLVATAGRWKPSGPRRSGWRRSADRTAGPCESSRSFVRTASDRPPPTTPPPAPRPPSPPSLAVRGWPHWEAVNVAAAPKGEGHAGRLFDQLTDITIVLVPRNDPARRFYGRQGFRPVPDGSGALYRAGPRPDGRPVRQRPPSP